MTLEEHILSDVSAKKDKLHLHIFNLGSVYCDWIHEFPTRILDKKKKEKKQLLKDLSNDPVLSQTEFFEGGTVRKRDGTQIFDTITLRASPAIASYLKEHYPDNAYRTSTKKTNNSIFLTQGYSDFMREQFANPSSIVTLDPTLQEVLKQVKTYNDKQQEIKKNIVDFFSNKSQSYATTTFRRLDKEFFKQQTSQQRNKNIFSQGYTKHLPQQLIKKRTRLQKTYHSLETIIATQPDMSIKQDEKSRELDVHLSSTKKITAIRSMNYADVIDQTWLFLDIEIPLFRHSNPEVSWVGMTYYKQGKIKREMHTLHNLEQHTFQKYSVKSYQSQEELIQGVSSSISKENPYFCAAYNGKFDFLKLREAGNFSIGAQQKPPLQTVATPFFERIDIKGREVVDLLRWAQLVYDYLPNKKLELVSRTALPSQHFEKSISYDEMESLELQAKDAKTTKEKVKAARTIADYLVGDVDIMPALFESDDFQTTLQHSTQIAQEFNVPLSWLLYSPRTLHIAQQREYKKRLGVPSDQVRFLRKNSRKEYSANKQKFRTFLTQLSNASVPAGIYDDISVGYIKYGHLCKEFIYKQFPQAQKLFSKKPTTAFENNLFGRWGNTLADWLVADYMELKKSKEKFEQKLSSKNITRADFVSIEGMVKYKKEPKKVSQFIQRNFSSEEEFTKLLGSWDKLVRMQRRFNAQYSPISQYHDPQNTNSSEIELENVLTKTIKNVKSFAQENNLKQIHQEGPYIYFQGDTSSSRHPQAFIQHIPRVIITKEFAKNNPGQEGKQHIFYKVNSITKGLKLVDHSTYNLSLFERYTIGSFLEECLKENYKKAISLLEKKTLQLKQQTVPTDDLIWYTKSKERYSAFEEGKKIYFHTQLTPQLKEQLREEQRNIIFDPLTKKRYYMQDINKHPHKVYFRDIEQIQPDFSLYQQRHQRKLLDWTYHLLGPSVLELLHSEQTPTLFSSFNQDNALKHIRRKKFIS